ncbi:oligosaccharide flippase family protein [uncultured Winogradskyella sp.]|uniref:oligosaccharide flippase family protein n=1 Tax=uncultured Winogradskyella sp. TaxID=395353 RepID=UPI0030EE2947|tara:strand:- start:3928 stop:5121 length:1194 start_codon:yes stop_codon:yes gene_type:complete
MKNKLLIIPFVEVFSKAVSFLNVLLLVRILPIQDYADYSYIVAIVLWSSVLMDGGINSLIYNRSLKNKKGGINILFTSRLFLSVVIISILGLLFILNKPELFTAGIVFSFTIYFSSSSALVKMLARGLGYIKVDLISIITEPLVRFGFLLIIYLTREYYAFSLNLVLVIYLFASIIAFFINKYFLNATFSLTLSLGSIKMIYKNIIISLNQSKFYLLYYLMFIGISRLDILFLESYSNKQDLAIFSSGLNMYMVAQLFFFSIITSQFIKLYEKRNLLFKFIIPILLLAVVCSNLISVYIFKYLFPIAYIEGQFVLNVLIIAILPAVINFYYITKNNYENKVKLNFVLLGLVFLIKLVMYLVLKPTDILEYCYIFLIGEILLSCLFGIKYVYESITNK